MTRRSSSRLADAKARLKFDVQAAWDAGYGYVKRDEFPTQRWTLSGAARTDWYGERRDFRTPRWSTRAAAEKVLVKLWRASLRR